MNRYNRYSLIIYTNIFLTIKSMSIILIIVHRWQSNIIYIIVSVSNKPLSNINMTQNENFL